MPVDEGIVARQPGESQHELEVSELDDVQGDVLRMQPMNPKPGGNEMGNRGCGTAVNELDRDGVGVGEGKQVGLGEDGGVEKGTRRARVDQGEDRDGLATR